jgi:uncharacterized protein YrrD
MTHSHHLDDLRPGADVVSSDDKEVGKLHAVIVDPREDRVTHIVVNTGPRFPQPGFGAPNLITVPVEQMEDAQEEKVLLKCSERQFDRMPSYVERRFTPPPSAAPSESERRPKERPAPALWDVGVALAGALAASGGIGVPAETFRKASFERQILDDAPVWRLEPFSHIGDVERVLIDQETDEIVALVIRRGVLFHHEVVLPIDYVTEVLDGFINVRLSDDELEKLEAYHPSDEER